MATTNIISAATFSEWDPKTPIAMIDATAEGFRVSLNVGSWVDTSGKDTAPVFATFAEAQAMAEKYGDALSEIKTAAAAKITALVQGLPDRKA